MSNVRGILNVIGEVLMFWCPGCDRAHTIGSGTWGFDGNYEAPTFTPSVLVYSHEKFVDATLASPELFAPENIKLTPRCHSFVTAGRIKFLADSTHSLAGQTVDLPPWPTGDGK